MSPHDPSNPRSILVTGASTGIGRAIVARALQGGIGRVFANVRKQADADALCAEFGERITPVLFDVSDEAGVTAGAARVAEALGGARLFGLVNNAGIAVPGPLLHTEIADLQRQLDVNLFGVHRVTRAFAALLGAEQSRTGPPGRIVMMSSVGGRQASPFNGPYHASKFALEGYSISLRKELMLYGIDVIVVGPGAVQTPIWSKADDEASAKFTNTPYAPYFEKTLNYMRHIGRHGLQPEAVGETVWRALTAENPRVRYHLAPTSLRNFIQGVLPARMVDKLTANWLGFPKSR